jgi:putative transposase
LLKNISSFHQILYHIVFGTKNRRPSIVNEFSEELYKYIWGIIKNKNCVLYRINGSVDHIHILCDLHSSICLSDFVKEIKVASSMWLKNSGKFPDFNGWAEGYAAITLSVKEKNVISEYIKKQKEHHKKVGFMDEYVKLLKENGIKYDKRYIIT